MTRSIFSGSHCSPIRTHRTSYALVRKSARKALDAPVDECPDALFAGVVGVDHLAVIDVVGVAGDLPN